MATGARLHGEVIGLLEARRASELATLISARGGQPLSAPTLREEPVGDDMVIAAFLDRLAGGEAPVIVFQTGVGTRALLDAAGRLGRLGELLDALAQRVVAVRGPKPTAVLRQAGVRVDVAAADPYTTTELLVALGGLDLRGALVALQHHGEPNADLRRALVERGAEVLDLTLYRWALPDDLAPVLTLLDSLERGAVAALVVTSQAQVAHLFSIAERHGRLSALKRALAGPVLVAAVGPVCAHALVERGVSVDIVPTPPKMGPLVLALAEALEGRPLVASHQ